MSELVQKLFRPGKDNTWEARLEGFLVGVFGWLMFAQDRDDYTSFAIAGTLRELLLTAGFATLSIVLAIWPPRIFSPQTRRVFLVVIVLFVVVIPVGTWLVWALADFVISLV